MSGAPARRAELDHSARAAPPDLRIQRSSNLSSVFFSAVAAHAFEVLMCSLALFVLAGWRAHRCLTACC